MFWPDALFSRFDFGPGDVCGPAPNDRHLPALFLLDFLALWFVKGHADAIAALVGGATGESLPGDTYSSCRYSIHSNLAEFFCSRPGIAQKARGG